MRHAALGNALLMAASSSSAETVPVAPASGDRFGTDVHLAPSEPDAVLRYADHPRGFAELRLPERAEAGQGPFPLAVIFHGGCWKAGVANQAYMAPLATRWQGQGIATLNVDYREVGDGGGWPGSFADWQAAAALIDEVAAAHPVDRARVALVGHSAGALPAQWLAMAQGSDGPLGARAPLSVRAAIVLDGPADIGAERAAFDALCEFSAVDPFMGGDPGRHAAISPLAHPPKLDELLFVQAVLASPPEPAQAAIRATGTRLEVRENPGASHFDVLTPGSEAYAANEPAMLKVLRGENSAGETP